MNHRYKAEIVNHEIQQNGKTLYKLEIKDTSTKKTKITQLRYSQFKDVHDQLEQVITKLKLNILLPEFPGRKLFGSTNKSEQAIMERQKGLVNYLNQLLQIQTLATLEIMKKHYIPDVTDQSNSPSKKQLTMNVCIDRYTLVDQSVVYYVRLRDVNSHEEWVYKARYSELRSLHQALEEAKIKNLPNFPKKKLFGMTNENPDDIQKRREQLQKYFNQIFNVRQVMNSEPIRYFLEESKKQAKKQKDFEAMRKMNNNA